MNDFVFHNPVKLIFGKGQIVQLEGELKQYGNRILLVYGGGSIKRNGLYDEVTTILKQAGKEVYELSGVEPNPRVSTARKGAVICKEQRIDFILAVGGGSVIDCAKLIASAAKYDGDAWDLVMRKVLPADALPIGTILTLAATGSEMNAGSVITNEETHEKVGWGGPLNFPKFSILDPAYTLSVPRDQTVYGIIDMMSHVLEQYFHNASNTPVQDELCEGILRAVIEAGPKLVKHPEDMELRETILLAGTMALNGMIGVGSKGDWASHDIEHAVSAVYDIPHAGGLSILFPNWMRYNVKVKPSRFARLAVKVFGVESAGKTEEEIAYEGIDRLRAFWDSLGGPNALSDYGIDGSQLERMAEMATANRPIGKFNVLHKEDVLKILQASI
ncbi:NADH-dependent butanol dehydrogenase [Bacillus sp. OxB-1]|uniref:iron-containing alcohol dehydrogenase n=1 Tax=Bacillus sp. (strain OxB-1) TaxID=98228 RepID=UPI0005821642|nr:iron-containing alcohol dehydrogenase [Bacillus sp. OxB-1]BAQ08492.1 NADH-dependent butanol dehydrogenase [Bacillus sp. OxB-1]